jgi:hypothetical protein
VAAFIKLTRRGMYQDPQGEVVINVDNIVSMDRDSDYNLTDVQMNFGRSFSVSETPDSLLRMIKQAREVADSGQ